MAIKVRGLNKSFFGKVILNNLRLEVESGIIYALLGENGSGKTTLLNILTGILKPDKSERLEILLNGYSLKEAPLLYKKQFGYVPSSPYFYEELTVREYLEFILYLYELDFIEERYQKLIELFGLNLEMFLRDLSFGQRQKVSILGAVLSNPPILFLDEATIGLDPVSLKFFKLFLYSFKRRGGTIVFATHILELAELLADKIGILKNGKIIAEGKLGDLKKRSKLKDTAKLEDIFLNLTGGQKYKSLLKEVNQLLSEKDENIFDW